MTDKMKPIREIRDRAVSDLALFDQFKTDVGLGGLAGLQKNAMTLREHLANVIATSDKLIADFERDENA